MRKIVFAALVAFGLTGCTGFNYGLGMATAHTTPTPAYANGAVFNLGGGILHRNSVPGPLGNASAKLTGRACSQSLFWLAAWGDSSIETAKANGNIKKVAAITYEQTAILGFVFHRFCTTVAGE